MTERNVSFMNRKLKIWGPNPENSKTQKSKATNRVETDEQTGEPTGGSEEKTHASTHLEGLTDETQVYLEEER